MNPVRTFDQITQEILDKYDYKTITVGILIADGNQTAARDYIINYMDKFDKESGKYIDFFVPGYCERISNSPVSIEKRYHPNAYEKWICMGDLPMFIIRRNQKAYYFDKFLFDDFIEEMETKMCIEYWCHLETLCCIPKQFRQSIRHIWTRELVFYMSHLRDGFHLVLI